MSESNALGCGTRQIDEPVTDVRPTVCDPDHHRLAILQVRHLDLGAQRKCQMGRRERAVIKEFAAGSPSPTPMPAVPTRDTILDISGIPRAGPVRLSRERDRWTRRE